MVIGSWWSSDGVLGVSLNLGSVVLLLLLLVILILFISHHHVSLSLVSEVLEFIMNKLDLLVGQAEALSVDQTLDGGELVNQNKVLVISAKVDRVEISEQKLLVEEVVASLPHGKIKDGATNFEQVFRNILLVTSVLLQV